jgi:acetoacetyl-CoA synthetase
MTIEEMMSVLKDEANARSSVLTRMKAGGRGRPLFLFPGAPGNLSHLAPLVEWIRHPAPIYGVNPRGVYPGETPHQRIEDMAEYAIEEIERAAQGGPYLLVGYSAGGLVAFEIACRLLSGGAQVALLALLDTYPSEATWPVRCQLEVLAKQFAYRMRELRVTPRTKINSFVRERFRGIFAYFWRSGLGLKGWQNPPSEILSQSEQRLYRATVSAAVRYRPRYYDRKVTFFRPEKIGMHPHDPGRVWGKFTRGLNTYLISGSHSEMHVEMLAAQLSACLETAAADSSCGSSKRCSDQLTNRSTMR